MYISLALSQKTPKLIRDSVHGVVAELITPPSYFVQIRSKYDAHVLITDEMEEAREFDGAPERHLIIVIPDRNLILPFFSQKIPPYVYGIEWKEDPIIPRLLRHLLIILHLRIDGGGII